jgi:hypothetical protein
VVAEDDNVSVSDDGGPTELEESPWLERLDGSYTGIVFGLLRVIVASVLLFWNEGHAVGDARTLAEGPGIARDVAADRIDPANNGRLVHVVGMLTTSGPAADPEFGIRIPAIRLKRSVEMFQWTETSETESTKKPDGGEQLRTVYKYKPAWSERPLDSETFHQPSGHTNPEMIYRTHYALAPQPRLGAFIVPPEMLYRFGKAEPFRVTDEQAEALRKRLDRPVQAIDGVLYISGNARHPRIGDFRIAYTDVPLQTASVVAVQAGRTFDAYHAREGGTVELMEPGRVAASDMFNEPRDDDSHGWTWLIRAGACGLMMFGFAGVLGPLRVLADVIPVMGEIMGAGVGLLALLPTCILAPVIIAISWLFYRPWVAAAVLAVEAVLAGSACWLARHRASPKVAAPG